MKINTIFLFLFCVLLSGCVTDVTNSSLEDDFKNPPAASKPKTWMHALSGNMSKEGLTKDLESIADVGLGGVLLFNVSANIPSGNITYNSEEHHAMIKHAAQECERLGLTFGFHNCDGWSSSGGPWITPENSMKMVVWSETVVDGGEIDTYLSQPFTRKEFYKDIAVLAYPALTTEIEDFNAKAIITSSDENTNVALLTDENPDNEAYITGDNPWIQFDYGKPRTIQSLSMVIKDRWGEAELWTSNDGSDFTLVKDLFKHKTVHQRVDFLDGFSPVSARYFRLKFKRTSAVKEISLSSKYTPSQLTARIGINRIDDAKLAPIGSPGQSHIIDPKTIVNMSSKMDSDGKLVAQLPIGKYTILRFGYTTNGLQNSPSSIEGRGLECDKFSKKALKSHYDAFISKAIQNLKGINAMQYIEIDSYEMAMQNWTDKLDSIFLSEKGYDMRKFLPLFAGRFVESAEASDAVLGDFRQVTCDLTTHNYYGYFTELCHKDGLRTYFEPYGDGLINELDVAKTADVNMGEFWLWRPVKMMEAAISGSHIYGKNIISAESFTSIPTVNWKGHPAMVKQKGDSAWTDGINEFMLHRFAHQANTHVKPGMTLDKWGFHFDRTNTWWYNAGAQWFKYMARGSHMLRQGVPVSDLLVFIGEGAPNAPFYREDFEPNIPVETNFDCINADAFINRIQIKNKKLVLPEGIEYQMLVLKHCEKLSLQSLKKIHEIALAGIPVVGVKSMEPIGYLVSDTLKLEFEKLVVDIKKQPKTYPNFNWEHIFSENNLINDLNFVDRDDMGYSHRKSEKLDIYFFYNREDMPGQFECDFRVNQKIPELWNPVNGEITKLGQFKNENGVTKAWINLQAQESVFVVFRESSKGIDAVSEPAYQNRGAAYVLNDKNELSLIVNENGSYSTELNSGAAKSVEIIDIAVPQRIEGSWDVEFLKQNNYHAIHVFDQLTDWKDNAEENIKFYSGTAIYRKNFQFSKRKSSVQDRLILDLGEVSVVAQITLNGHDLGVLWLSPFTVDITSALVSGENKLEIEITNQWTNRLIGDERFPANDGYDKSGEKMPQWYVNNQPMPQSERTSFCTAQFYSKNSPLMSSGLLGPVQIKTYKRVVLK